MMADPRKPRVGRSKSAAQDSAFKFGPQVGILGLIAVLGAISTSVSVLPRMARLGLVSFFFVLSTIYLAWAVFRTIDSIAIPVLLHKYDRWVYRYSGVLANGLAVVIVVIRASAGIFSGEEGPQWAASNATLYTFHALFEIGMILCLACLWARSNLNHARPVMLWKSLSIATLLAFGLGTVMITITIISLANDT